MKKLNNLAQANVKVLKDAQGYIARIRHLGAKNVDNVSDAIGVLRTIRAELYEDLNQIQHEEMILRAIGYLQKHGRDLDGVEWNWNPRQTGSGNEPDLRGTKNGSIVLSAEITTSEKPVGILDTRMQATLTKLNKMPGVKYYFVRTSAMQKRAQTKAAKNRYNISIRTI